jgi:hypothetical protein
MKKNEIKKIVEPLIPKIAEVCEQFDAPFGKVVCSGATNRRQQAGGCRGTITVVLNDRTPGWRSKDNHAGRLALKQSVREILSALDYPFNVKVQASYSCMWADDGVAYRRNDKRCVIGAYAAWLSE